jgi:hypothetical protein
MRPQNSTLTVRQVHRCAAAILQDHLKLPDHGPKCRAGPLLTLLFYAAARLTSLSDACQSLRDAPSDEAAWYPFLMPVICRGRDLDDPRGPSGTKVFLTWQHSGLGTYTLHDARKRSARRRKSVSLLFSDEGNRRKSVSLLFSDAKEIGVASIFGRKSTSFLGFRRRK